MNVLAHIAGVPVEELLTVAPGAAAGLLLARAWLMLHLGRGRGRGREPET